MEKTYRGSVKYFWKFEVQKPRSPDEYGVITPFNVPGSNFCQSEILTGAVLSISEVQKSRSFNDLNMEKIQRSKVMVTTWPNFVQNAVVQVMTECAHYKKGFLGPMCALGKMGQFAEEGIPLML